MRPAGRALLPLLPLIWNAAALAAAPEWLRSLVAAPLPSYPAKTSAVILLDVRVVTVRDSGDMKTNRRLEIKILRPEGQKYGVFPVGFDRDTRITFFRGCSFHTEQPEYEVEEKDAIETGYSGDSLYSDVRRKILSVPTSGPGTVVAFEYEQKNRPFLLQDVWEFQRTIPVRKARFVLQLPPGWEFKQ